MPLTPSLPTWAAWNNANFTSPTGLTDPDSGQPIAAGGLNLGDYFDATNQEAANASNAAVSTLYAGRYRLVQVDSGATAANVKTGTVGFMRYGGFGAVKSVIITNAGTGATPGTYQINADLGSGGGAGAVISVTVGAGGTITAATLVSGGYGYVAVPTFTLTATGTTNGAVAAQLDMSPNIVTSADKAAIPSRPVVFLNSITPGNYGFIQELGTATVLAGTVSGTPGLPLFVNAASGSGSTGTVTVALASAASPVSTTIGTALDAPVTGVYFKTLLNYVPVVQD